MVKYWFQRFQFVDSENLFFGDNREYSMFYDSAANMTFKANVNSTTIFNHQINSGTCWKLEYDVSNTGAGVKVFWIRDMNTGSERDAFYVTRDMHCKTGVLGIIGTPFANNRALEVTGDILLVRNNQDKLFGMDNGAAARSMFWIDNNNDIILGNANLANINVLNPIDFQAIANNVDIEIFNLSAGNPADPINIVGWKQVECVGLGTPAYIPVYL